MCDSRTFMCDPRGSWSAPLHSGFVPEFRTTGKGLPFHANQSRENSARFRMLFPPSRSFEHYDGAGRLVRTVSIRNGLQPLASCHGTAGHLSSVRVKRLTLKGQSNGLSAFNIAASTRCGLPDEQYLQNAKCRAASARKTRR